MCAYLVGVCVHMYMFMSTQWQINATFDYNQGLLGGEITLLGAAFIQVGEDATTNFYNDHTSQHGVHYTITTRQEET